MNHTKDEWYKHWTAKRILAESEWAADILETEIAVIQDLKERMAALAAWRMLNIPACGRALDILSRLKANSG